MKRARSPRLTSAERRQQLLTTARLIVRQEGADRFTLGHLAECAAISKPVVYDDFPTKAFIHCAADTQGEVAAIGAALAGSEEKAVVLRELFDYCVDVLVSVLVPHS